MLVIVGAVKPPTRGAGAKTFWRLARGGPALRPRRDQAARRHPGKATRAGGVGHRVTSPPKFIFGVFGMYGRLGDVVRGFRAGLRVRPYRHGPARGN